MAFSYTKIINSGSSPSRLFLGTPRSLNSLDPNTKPNPRQSLIIKTNRVRIPNATHRPSSYVASFAVFAMLKRSVANDFLTVGKELRTLADEFIPREYQEYYIHEMRKLLVNNDTDFTIVIDEYQPQSNTVDQMFKAVETYLGTKVNESCVRKVNLCKIKENLAIRMNENEEIVDEFDGVEVKWRSTTKIEQGEVHLGQKCYELTFHNKHRFKIIESYLKYIMERSDAVKANDKGLKLHMIGAAPKSIVIDNPMTFKTLAIEHELKKSIIEDLNNFKDGKDYYRRIGKAWKRDYLIYGTTCTGKSSLLVSMANYLNYELYDVDLSDVKSDSQLKNILLEIPNKSLLIFEDFDQLQNPMGDDTTQKVSQNSVFSRLLNLMDGIWSSCGEERIFVFTTKCIDRLDPALLRPCQMDIHIHMSYCTFSAFKQLAFNYLELEDHKLFALVEELLQIVNVTPAQVSGELIRYTKDPTMSLERLIAYLELSRKDVCEP